MSRHQLFVEIDRHLPKSAFEFQRTEEVTGDSSCVVLFYSLPGNHTLEITLTQDDWFTVTTYKGAHEVGSFVARWEDLSDAVKEELECIEEPAKRSWRQAFSL